MNRTCVFFKNGLRVPDCSRRFADRGTRTLPISISTSTNLATHITFFGTSSPSGVQHSDRRPTASRLTRISAAPLSITPLVALGRRTSYCRGGKLAFRSGLPPEGRNVPNRLPGCRCQGDRRLSPFVEFRGGEVRTFPFHAFATLSLCGPGNPSDGSQIDDCLLYDCRQSECRPGIEPGMEPKGSPRLYYGFSPPSWRMRHVREKRRGGSAP